MRNVKIQMIEKQGAVFRLQIGGKPFTFIGLDLYRGNDLLPMPRKVKGSTLGWNVAGGWVSYWQIKRAMH